MKKLIFALGFMFITLSLQSQEITHKYHLNKDTLTIDSLTTIAYYKDVKVFERKEAVKDEDAQDLTEYHYFLGLIAICNYKNKHLR